MSTSVGMKARKKQLALLTSAPVAKTDPALESALMALESVCAKALEDGFSGSDEDDLCWQQRFKNIVTPISLALAELKGPRHFHNHYRHREDDDSVLKPVLEDPHAMMAHACELALEQCQNKLSSHNRLLIDRQRRLETALRTFLFRYKE